MFCFGPVQIIFLGNKSEKKKFSNTLDDLRHNEMEAMISYLDGRKSVEKEKIELETNVDISFRPIFSHLDIFSKISWTQIKAA